MRILDRRWTPLLQLVGAYRNTEGQPRQRVVASLGNAGLPAGDPRRLAQAVEDQINGQTGLLDEALTAETAAWVVHVASLAKRSKGGTAPVGGTVIDGVLLDELETEQIVELGPQLVAMKACDALGFTPMLHNLGMSAAAIATARLMVANRLIHPLSEWALIDWARRTTLQELLDVRLSKTTKDRLYRVSDELLKHRKPIETCLRDKSRDLFSLNRSVILYDVTNTHFARVGRFCTLTQSGDVRDWQTLRWLLRTHSVTTTRLPLTDGRVIEVRKPSRPDAEQALVYQTSEWNGA